MGHFAEKNERTLKWDVPLKCVTSVSKRSYPYIECLFPVFAHCTSSRFGALLVVFEETYCLNCPNSLQGGRSTQTVFKSFFSQRHPVFQSKYLPGIFSDLQKIIGGLGYDTRGMSMAMELCIRYLESTIT